LKQGFLFFLLLPVLALPVRGEVSIGLPEEDAALEANLRARLALERESCEAPDWRVRRLFKRAEKDFQPAFRALGYYRPKVQKDLEMAGDCWHANFDIDPGERVKVRKRSVIVRGEALQDDRLQPLLDALPLGEGAPLNHAEYEDIKTRLRDFSAERGYLDFVLTKQELRVYPDQAAAEIEVEADSGARYRFGELRLSTHRLDDRLLRRLAKIREGELYDARALTALDRDLSDSGYFRDVEVRPRRSEAKDGKVPIDVRLEQAKRHSWRTGIGFATDTGPRLSLGYENRFINARGHQLDAELRLSPVESGIGADYMIPGRDPHRETFNFGATLLHEDTDSAVSDRVTLIASQTLKDELWTQTRFVELLHEQSTVGDDDTTATFLMPGIRFDAVKADDPLKTRRGYRVSVELRGAHEGLFSTASMLQLRAYAKGIHRLGEGGRITVRADAGTTLVDSKFDLPASLRFFAGGDNSVRGYKYKSLGPVDDEGEPVGGSHVLTGSVEYEHPVVGDEWWAAAFVDAGNAFGGGGDADLEVGYGVGVRWYSPVGRLRLDLAVPEDNSRDDWRIHFGLGADL
jgi:translocation and assembly module TamA